MMKRASMYSHMQERSHSSVSVVSYLFHYDGVCDAQIMNMKSCVFEEKVIKEVTSKLHCTSLFSEESINF